MSNIHNIEYKPKDYGHAEIFVDGKRIRCSRFSFEHDAKSIPYAEIEVYAKSDIKALADIGLRLRIDDINSAIMCLRLAYQLDSEFKKSFLDELEGIFSEMDNSCSDSEKAMFTAERLISQ